MKKLFSVVVLAMLALGSSFNASAQTDLYGQTTLLQLTQQTISQTSTNPTIVTNGVFDLRGFLGVGSLYIAVVSNRVDEGESTMTVAVQESATGTNAWTTIATAATSTAATAISTNVASGLGTNSPTYTNNYFFRGTAFTQTASLSANTGGSVEYGISFGATKRFLRLTYTFGGDEVSSNAVYSASAVLRGRRSAPYQ